MSDTSDSIPPDEQSDPASQSPDISGQAHDALFRLAFSRPEIAREFLQRHLPPALASGCDWSTLESLPGHFIDDNLKQSQCDMLFQVEREGKATALYVLLEHQSTPDPWIALRLLKYMVRIWERFRDENPGRRRLPLVIPFVVAQCIRPWTSPPSFADLVDVAAGLEAWVPDFRYELLDLLLSEEQFDDHSQPLRGLLGLMRAARLKQELFEQFLKADGPGFVYLYRDDDRVALADAMVAYVLSQIEKSDLKEFQTLLKGVVPEEKLMSLASKLMAEGRAEGRVEGRAEGEARGRAKGREEGEAVGLRKAVLTALSARFGATSGQRAEPGLAAVQDSKVLTELLFESLHTSTLDEFLARLARQDP